jgi:AMIN domain
MNRRSLLAPLLLALSCTCYAGATPAGPPPGGRKSKPATIRRINVLGSGADVGIEIGVTRRITAQTQVLSDPDRIVIDLLGAMPGQDVSPIEVNRGGVKRVRVGLRTSNPPVTRVVLELVGPQKFQIFPSSDSVIVRLGSGDVRSASAQQPAVPPQPPLRVTFQNDLLSIRAEKATLSQVLYEIQRLTGADIPIPAGAEREQIVTNLGPGPAREVLAALLNGSHYNFVILGADDNSTALQQVILTPRFGSVMADDSPDTTAPPETAPPAMVQRLPPQAVRNPGQGDDNGSPEDTVNGAPDQNAPPN